MALLDGCMAFVTDTDGRPGRATSVARADADASRGLTARRSTPETGATDRERTPAIRTDATDATSVVGDRHAGGRWY